MQVNQQLLNTVTAMGLVISPEYTIQYTDGNPVTTSDNTPFAIYNGTNEEGKHYFNPYINDSVGNDTESFNLLKDICNQNISALALIILIEATKFEGAGNTKLTKLTEGIKKSSGAKFRKLYKAFGNGDFVPFSLTLKTIVKHKGETYPVGTELESPFKVMFETNHDLVSDFTKNDKNTLNKMISYLGIGIKSVSSDENYPEYLAFTAGYNAVLAKLAGLLSPLKKENPNAFNDIPLSPFDNNLLGEIGLELLNIPTETPTVASPILEDVEDEEETTEFKRPSRKKTAKIISKPRAKKVKSTSRQNTHQGNVPQQNVPQTPQVKQPTPEELANPWSEYNLKLKPQMPQNQQFAQPAQMMQQQQFGMQMPQQPQFGQQMMNPQFAQPQFGQQPQFAQPQFAQQMSQQQFGQPIPQQQQFNQPRFAPPVQQQAPQFNDSIKQSLFGDDLPDSMKPKPNPYGQSPYGQNPYQQVQQPQFSQAQTPPTQQTTYSGEPDLFGRY